MRFFYKNTQKRMDGRNIEKIKKEAVTLNVLVNIRAEGVRHNSHSSQQISLHPLVTTDLDLYVSFGCQINLSFP